MYKAGQEAGARPESGPGSGPAGDVGGAPGDDAKVVDAEFEEVDDEKKKGKSA
jgi:molecular chaperone DnaK